MKSYLTALLASSALVSAGLIRRDDNSTTGLSDDDLQAAIALLASSSSGTGTDSNSIQDAATAAVIQALAVPEVVVAASINNQSISAANASTVTVLSTTVQAVNSNVTGGTVLAASNTVAKRATSLMSRLELLFKRTTIATTQTTSAGRANTQDVGFVEPTDEKIVHPTISVPSGYTVKWGPLKTSVNSPADFLGGYAYPSIAACSAHCDSISTCAGFNSYLLYNDVPGNSQDVDFQTEQDLASGAIYGSLRCAFYGSYYDTSFATNSGNGDYGQGTIFITDSYFFTKNGYKQTFSCPADMHKTYGPQTGSNQATSGYMGVAALTSYDVAACEQICKSALPDANTGPCNYINIWTQKDANGNVLNHMCALYSYIQDGKTATNLGATNAIGCAVNSPRFMLKAITNKAVLANNKYFWWRIFPNYDGTFLAQWDNQVGQSTIFELHDGFLRVVSGECTGCTVIQEYNHIINLGPTNTATDGKPVDNWRAEIINSFFGGYINSVQLVTTPWGTNPRPAYGVDSRYSYSAKIPVAAVGYQQGLNYRA